MKQEELCLKVSLDMMDSSYDDDDLNFFNSIIASDKWVYTHDPETKARLVVTV